MKRITAVLLLLIVLNCSMAEGVKDKCRVLAQRGGGTKGSYSVGVLKAMIDMLEPEDYHYDVVVGTSVGAIGALMLSFYPPG
jgi:predicted acylesterase/phospholipase RssA